MRASWSNFAHIIALSVCLASPESWGSGRKHWVMLANCQYVAHADNDGDSFHVHCGTNEFIVRLYFVDAPETNLRYPERTREQSEHFGVTLDQSMKAGRVATETVRETLRKPFVVWTRWASAGGRSKQPRYYGFVQVGDKGLAEILVSKGLARKKGVTAGLPTGQKSRAYAEKLQALEVDAKRQRLGVWADSTEDKTVKDGR